MGDDFVLSEGAGISVGGTEIGRTIGNTTISCISCKSIIDFVEDLFSIVQRKKHVVQVRTLVTMDVATLFTRNEILNQILESIEKLGLGATSPGSLRTLGTVDTGEDFIQLTYFLKYLSESAKKENFFSSALLIREYLVEQFNLSTLPIHRPISFEDMKAAKMNFSTKYTVQNNTGNKTCKPLFGTTLI